MYSNFKLMDIYIYTPGDFDLDMEKSSIVHNVSANMVITCDVYSIDSNDRHILIGTFNSNRTKDISNYTKVSAQDFFSSNHAFIVFVEEIRKLIKPHIEYVIGAADKPLDMKNRVGIMLATKDKASQTYVNHKQSKFASEGIISEVVSVFPSTYDVIKDTIKDMVSNPKYIGIIAQLPMDNIPRAKYQELLDLIPPHLDLDNLGTHFSYSLDKKDLPITSEILADEIEFITGAYPLHLPNKYSNFKFMYKEDAKILLIGYGSTTNKRLFNYLLEKGFNVRVINSRTCSSKEELEELKNWANIIVASTGVAESVDMQGYKNKILISPTITRNSENKLSNDFINVGKEHNTYHPITGYLGVLTVSKIIERTQEKLGKNFIQNYRLAIL